MGKGCQSMGRGYFGLQSFFLLKNFIEIGLQTVRTITFLEEGGVAEFFLSEFFRGEKGVGRPTFLNSKIVQLTDFSQY